MGAMGWPKCPLRCEAGPPGCVALSPQSSRFGDICCCGKVCAREPQRCRECQKVASSEEGAFLVVPSLQADVFVKEKKK